MFMRVNSKCADQVRPPLTLSGSGAAPGPAPHRVRLPHKIGKVWSIACESAEVSPQQGKNARPC